MDEYRRSCRQDAFRARLLDYVESILQATAPSSPSSVCPKCDANALQPRNHTRAAFKKPARGSGRPVSCSCMSCNSEFGGDELLRAFVAKRSLDFHGIERLLAKEAIDFANAHPTPLPIPGDGHDQASLVATLSLLVYQNHHWFHSKGCFKATRRTPKGDVCRMFFPKKRCPRTTWTPDGCLELARNCGEEYLNAYVPIFAWIFKMNHDAKFLTAGEGKIPVDGSSHSSMAQPLIIVYEKVRRRLTT